MRVFLAFFGFARTYLLERFETSLTDERCTTRNLQNVRLLAYRGCDLSKGDNQSVTPAFFAAQEGHAECLSLLMSLGANASVKRADSATPLIIAAQNGHDACVKILLDPPAVRLLPPPPPSLTPPRKRGHDSGGGGGGSGGQLPQPAKTRPPREGLDDVTSSGYTALCLVAAAGEQACAEELLAAGADVEVCDRKGRSPLYLAAAAGDAVMCGLLIGRGAEPRRRAADGLEPALVAATLGHASAARRIVKDARLDPEEVRDAAGVSVSKYLADAKKRRAATSFSGAGNGSRSSKGYGDGSRKVAALLPASVARLPPVAPAGGAATSTRQTTGNNGGGWSHTRSNGSGIDPSSRNAAGIVVEASSAPAAVGGAAAVPASAPPLQPASRRSGKHAVSEGAGGGASNSSWSGVHGGEEQGVTVGQSTPQRRRPVRMKKTDKDKDSIGATKAAPMAPSAQQQQQLLLQQQQQQQRGMEGSNTLLTRMTALLFDSNGGERADERQPSAALEEPAAATAAAAAAGTAAVTVTATGAAKAENAPTENK